ncbi:hypothetical protein RYX36_000687 [Vicia faba]
MLHYCSKRPSKPDSYNSNITEITIKRKKENQNRSIGFLGLTSLKPNGGAPLVEYIPDNLPFLSFTTFSNPDAPPYPSSSSQSNLYPSINFNDLVQNLFPEDVASAVDTPNSPSAPLETTEEILVKIPGAILNLIDKEYSVELASGDFTIVRLRQGENSIAVYARIADEIQWPLAKEETSVKVDDSHYFFSFLAPKGFDEDDEDQDRRRKNEINSDLLSYGLTIASKGQESLLKELDTILANCSNFSVQKVSEKTKKKKFERLFVRERKNYAARERDTLGGFFLLN